MGELRRVQLEEEHESAAGDTKKAKKKNKEGGGWFYSSAEEKRKKEENQLLSTLSLEDFDNLVQDVILLGIPSTIREEKWKNLRSMVNDALSTATQKVIWY